MSEQQPCEKVKTIDSYLSHAPRLG